MHVMGAEVEVLVVVAEILAEGEALSEMVSVAPSGRYGKHPG